MKAELLELAMANGSLPEHELEALLVNAMKEKLVALGRNVGSEASNNGRPEIGVASNEADEGSEGWNEDASMIPWNSCGSSGGRTKGNTRFPRNETSSSACAAWQMLWQ